VEASHAPGTACFWDKSMKLLFASLDTPGFLFPAIGLAKAMADRGHKVALLTSPSWRSLVRQMGVMPLKELWVEGEPSCFTTAQWGQVKVIERQVRCLESVLEGDAFDLLIGHELLIGPHLLARRSGMPLAVMGMATWPGHVPERAPELEGIDRQTIEWYRRDMMARYRQALERFNLETPALEDFYAPPNTQLYMIRSVPELEQDFIPERPSVQCVGACLWSPPIKDPRLELWLSQAPERPLAYVSLGRRFGGPDLLPLIKKVGERCGFRLVVSAGRLDAPLTDTSATVYTSRFVSFAAVRLHVRAVLAEAHTTPVLLAATAGLPALLLSRGSMTDLIAARYARSGAALHLPLDAVTGATLEQSFKRLLGDASLSTAASGLRQAFGVYRGFDYAARWLEQAHP
jgi:UDP:flavonoid glycosyltransferase YjiC (YdhE family)